MIVAWSSFRAGQLFPQRNVSEHMFTFDFDATICTKKVIPITSIRQPLYAVLFLHIFILNALLCYMVWEVKNQSCIKNKNSAESIQHHRKIHQSNYIMENVIFSMPRFMYVTKYNLLNINPILLTTNLNIQLF